jgi:hypothetical protein
MLAGVENPRGTLHWLIAHRMRSVLARPLASSATNKVWSVTNPRISVRSTVANRQRALNSFFRRWKTPTG